MIVEVNKMQGKILFIVTAIIAIAIIVILFIYFYKKHKRNKYFSRLDDFEREKNLIASTPIGAELSKVEPIIKNDKMEEKYAKWQQKYEKIKTEDITKLEDMIIELDQYIDKKEYKEADNKFAKLDMQLHIAREHADSLLDAIKEITLSEEKYRSIVIKLKAKYRELNKDYQQHQDLYDEMKEAVLLQLENIEKRFLDFEKVMNKNEYNEVVHIVKALDTMIDHMEIVVREVPDLLLMGKQLLPKRMKEIKETADALEKEGYSLEYLNINYNLDEAKKNIDTILDKVRVLNLEDCMFELKTILDYMDSLFVDFEKERLSRKVYEEMNNDFNKKLKRVNESVDDIHSRLDEIKNMYDLNEDDIKTINDIKKDIAVINDDYKKLTSKEKKHATPYSELHKEIEEVSNRLNSLEENLDISLKSLGNMHDDELRAREQLDEIEDFLKKCKIRIRSYKLPIITDKYFVELNEANEAIVEVIKELEKKPIVINTLNTRVDTARDLVLKLYNTTVEMVKFAKMAEDAICYSNRYRGIFEDVDDALNATSKEFFKGNYEKSYNDTIKLIQDIDPNFQGKLVEKYES